LVAGGTGRLGAVLVPRLAASGHAVRVLTRDPQRGSGLPAAVERMTGDLRVAADVKRAVAGCRVVISAVHGFAGPGNQSPEAIDRDANCRLIDAAKAAGVEHFVLISGQGAAADHPLSLHRAKYAAEEALRKSGLTFTILRPTAFLETWVWLLDTMVKAKGHALVFGPGQNPINFVSVHDVAALTLLAVEDGALRNETIELEGPENLSFVVLAQRLLEVRRNATPIRHVPLPVLRLLSVVARPFSPDFARQTAAAVFMNTHDQSFEDSSRLRFPTLPRTTLNDVLAQG